MDEEPVWRAALRHNPFSTLLAIFVTMFRLQALAPHMGPVRD